MRKPVFGVSDQVRHTLNQAEPSKKLARSLKFRIKVVKELYCPYCENKGADQLRDQLSGYREADLRLCFRICKKTGFPTMRLILSRPVILDNYIITDRSNVVLLMVFSVLLVLRCQFLCCV